MGMFDSLYDSDGNEWQTKAFGCALDVYRVGDALPTDPWIPPVCQVKVLGGGVLGAPWVDSHATIRDGILTSVPDERDPRLPLLDYHGGICAAGSGLWHGHH